MPTHPVASALLPISQVHSNPDQPRKTFDAEGHKALKESIQERSLINPISVMQRGEGDYLIVAGERRYRAVCDLGWQEIDARIWPQSTPPQEVELISLVENLQRKDLNPMELANEYKLLTQPPHNMTQEDIAKQLGKTQQAVAQYISISQLDPKVQEITIRIVNLGIAHLLQLCRLKTPEEQIELAKKASEGEWTVKQLTAEVNKKLKGEGGGEKGAGAVSPVAHHPSPADPLAGLWGRLHHDPRLGPPTTWQVTYGGSFRWTLQFGTLSADLADGPAGLQAVIANWLGKLADSLKEPQAKVKEENKVVEAPKPEEPSPGTQNPAPQTPEPPALLKEGVSQVATDLAKNILGGLF
jgi:ParB/RepB/Spo0J family partition protein